MFYYVPVFASCARYIVDFAYDAGIPLPAMPETYEAMLLEFVASAAEWTMTGKTLREQAALIAEHDVLIAPHGAQNANFAFLRKGTVVLEMFEYAYVLPMYLALALDAGAAKAFIMVADAPTVDAAVWKTMESKPTRCSTTG